MHVAQSLSQSQCSGDKELASAVAEGHRWWVLSEDTPEEDQLLISEYRNSDQNTAQAMPCFPGSFRRESIRKQRVPDNPRPQYTMLIGIHGIRIVSPYCGLLGATHNMFIVGSLLLGR